MKKKIKDFEKEKEELWEEKRACCQNTIQDTVKESEGKGMSRGDTD